MSGSKKRAECFVYLARCADGTVYAGYTTDLGRRMAEHNSGKGARYTRGRRPISLGYYERLADRPSALRREAQLKRLTRSQKLQLCRAGAPHSLH